MLDQRRAPLFDSLIRHRHAQAASFHVPGHKQGEGVDPAVREIFHSIMSIDQTEIPGLDDLHHPEEAILEAEQLAAQCFGADETLFLVGGSTAGNLAMVMSVCKRGDTLLVQRDVHKSVIHALMLAGAKAVFITPRMEESSGISLGLCIENIRTALDAYPEAKGLLVTNPSYYGIGVDLTPVADLLHQRGKVLLVDEAHGAHFGFHPDVPKSAMSCGADAVVQSTHKMLTSMTMTAMLHLRGSRIPVSEIKKILAMLQSSSPSYPLMASLDIARRQMALCGEEWLARGMEAAECLKRSVQKLTRWRVRENENTTSLEQANNKRTVDPLKLLIYDGWGIVSGFEFKKELEQRGCFPEMADMTHVLLTFGPGSTIKNSQRLFNALLELETVRSRDTGHAAGRNKPISFTYPQLLSEPVPFQLIDSAVQQSVRLVPLEESCGLRSAEFIVPYPPGIPLLFPGERISGETVTYLKRLAGSSCKFHGYDAASHRKIPVIDV